MDYQTTLSCHNHDEFVTEQSSELPVKSLLTLQCGRFRSSKTIKVDSGKFDP